MTREPAALALDQLEKAMSVVARVERAGDAIDCPELRLRVVIDEIDVRDGGVVIVYGALLGDEHVQILAVGRGESLEQQLGEAALQWTTGVFSVLQHYRAPDSHSCFVGDLEFSAGGLHWRLHSGPVIARTWLGDEDASPGITPRDIGAVLMGAFSAVAENRTPLWVEAFAISHADGTVEVTCRLCNQPWEEGHDSLLAWAEDWELPPDVTFSARQFLFYEPIAATAKPPWWRRIFR